MYPVLFIHPSVDGRMGRLRFLAIVNRAAFDIGVQISLRISAFSYLRCLLRIAGSPKIIFLNKTCLPLK